MTDVARLLLYAAVANGISLITGVEEMSTDGPGSGDSTEKFNSKDYLNDLTSSKNMTRMMIGLVTISIVAMLFFVLKWWSGRKHNKTKKYGVLATSGNDVELRRLEDDEEDEDETVFDVNR